MKNSVATLVCHRDVATAIPCLRSVALMCDVAISVFDDGTITLEDKYKLEESIPGAVVVLRKDCSDRIEALLANRPACQRYWSDNIFRLKTFAIPLIAKDVISYVDSDILFFRPCTTAFELDQYHCDSVFMSDVKEAYTIRPWDLIGRTSVKLCSKVNAGFILMRHEIYDLDFVEWFLRRYSTALARVPWWADQTLWSALGARCRTKLLSSKSMVLMRPGVALHDAVAGHFVTTFRHLLPQYLNLAVENQNVELRLQCDETRDCGAAFLAFDQVIRKLESLKWRRHTPSTVQVRM